MCLKIGITGNMGSGKTTICKIFRILGIPVFDADLTGKELLNSHPEVKEKIFNLFGKEVYINNQEIDRKKIADIIFSNKLLLQKVNEIIHPQVQKTFELWLKKQNSPYILHEAAILFESGFYKLTDQNILVIADKELRINRILKRDNLTKQEILDRMSNQWDDTKKKELSDTVIYNNGEMLIPQVLDIDRKLKKYGKVR